MSYDSLREAIVENIRPNGNQEITGQALQDALLGIIDEAEAADNLAAPKSDTYNKAEVGNLVAEAVAPKADKDGTYEQMTVGFAQDIVGDGSATEEEFSFRPTAGEDRNVANTTYYEGERNGVARIEKIKGNSVVWNQQAVSIAEIVEHHSDKFTYNSETNTISVRADNVASSLALNINAAKSSSIIGHLYLLYFEGSGLDNAKVSLGFESTKKVKPYEAFIGMCEVSRYFYLYPFGTSGSVTAGTSFTLTEIKLTDLTQMFVAGNEPTTVEEFYERLPKGVDINAYNAGKIVDGNYGAIKTVGFNAFNGTYAKVCAGCPYYLGGNYTSLGFATEEGGTLEAITLPTSADTLGTTPSDRLYTPTQNGYIYAEGENININLSWNTEYGYLNGTLQPYKPFERDLSWVNKYFPNGMRSAGSVRDEIRFNSTTQKWEAVQNVGVRAYASGDESNSAVINDGTNTNYALTTPVVTEIEETPSMDFDVSDFGTEELIVADGVQSAALVADISYSPNALSTLKQVPDILKRLKALESAVASQTTNVEPSNIEE